MTRLFKLFGRGENQQPYNQARIIQHKLVLQGFAGL
jgi:hypothetical protein